MSHHVPPAQPDHNLSGHAEAATPNDTDPTPHKTAYEISNETAAETPTQRTVALVLLVAGLVGFAAAFILAVEKFLLLTNPFYTPSCSINAAVSCTSVMQSAQSAVFGFPNPLLGIGGFAVVATTGAIMCSGGRLPGWFRAGLQAGAVAAVLFVGWLIGQSLFVIRALCPYCMIVWVATITTFWYLTLDNLHRIRNRLPKTTARAVNAARRNHSAILLLALLGLTGFVVVTAITL